MAGEKIIVLGIDGATWDIIKPQLEKEGLPSFKRLTENGAWAQLESCIPPMSDPAWVSIATGKNPGKTGVFDFFSRVNENTLQTSALNSRQIKRARPFWDFLLKNNYRVGIWNYPFLFPVYEINGFMVSGEGSSPEGEISYPKKLKQELFSECDGYRITVPHGSKKYVGNTSLFISDLWDLLIKNEKAIKFLLKRKNVDVFFGVIAALDFAQHYLWRYIDKNYPGYEETPYKDEFFRVLRKIDDLISDILKIASDNTHIIIVSDHGFGPYKETFYVNTWLIEQGFLRKRKLGFYFQVLKALIRRLNLNFLRSIVMKPSSLFSGLNANEYRFDLGKSIAVGINTTGMGGITINPRIVNSKAEYHRLREHIIQKLKETCLSLNIKCKIFLPENIYHGPFSNLAADILFSLDDGATSAISGQSNRLFIKHSGSSSHTGTHHMNGIFLAYGPDIKQGIEIQGAKIYDIAPTILHMFGLPVPDDMDGRVLTEIFRKDSEMARRPVRYQEVGEKSSIRSKIRGLKKSGRI